MSYPPNQPGQPDAGDRLRETAGNAAEGVRDAAGDVAQGVRSAASTVAGEAQGIARDLGNTFSGNSVDDIMSNTTVRDNLNTVLRALRVALSLPKVLFAIIAAFLVQLVLSLFAPLGGAVVNQGYNFTGSFSLAPNFSNGFGPAIFSILAIILFAVGYAVVFGTVVKMCMDELESGRQTTWQAALGHIMSNMGSYMLAPLLLSLFYTAVVLVESLVGLLGRNAVGPTLGYLLFIPLILFNIIVVVSVVGGSFILFPVVTKEKHSPLEAVGRALSLIRRAIGPVVIFAVIYLLLSGLFSTAINALVGLGTSLTRQVFAGNAGSVGSLFGGGSLTINDIANAGRSSLGGGLNQDDVSNLGNTGIALNWAVGVFSSLISALIYVVLPAAAGSALYLSLAPKYPPLPKPVRAAEPQPQYQQTQYQQPPTQYGQPPQQPQQYQQPPAQYGQPPAQYDQPQQYQQPPAQYQQPPAQYGQQPYAAPPQAGNQPQAIPPTQHLGDSSSTPVRPEDMDSGTRPGGTGPLQDR